MQQEQEHFKKVAANLGLIVEDLRMRMSGLRMEQEKLTQTLK